MSKATDAIADRLTVGTRLECTENTYWLASMGKNPPPVTITKQGRRVFDCVSDDGKPFRLELKARLTMLDADTFHYPTGKDAHTATWRIVADA